MERITELRKKLKLNQKEFAERLGVYRTEVSKLESDNTRKLTARQKFLIVQAFNVSVEWLETGRGDMFNHSGNAVASSMEPFNYAFSKGLGRNTAAAFARLCDMTPAEKEQVEKLLSDARLKAAAAFLFGGK